MNGTFQATRYHDICCGHRVVGHEGKCRYLHGHNYRIHFTVEAGANPPVPGGVGYRLENQLDSVGRVVDFSVIKNLAYFLEENWDHKFLLWDQDKEVGCGLGAFPPEIWESFIFVPFNPTAENIAQHLVEKIGPHILPEGVRLVKVVIEETRKCSASYEVYR